MQVGTRVKGTASFQVDFWVDEDLNDLEAENYFNDAVQDLFNSGSDSYDGNSSVEYDQTHEFYVTEDGELDEDGVMS